MAKYNLIATCTFGIESIVAQELRDLGHKDLDVQNGKISFIGDEKAIAQTNIWLRTADRVFIKLSEFKAIDFEALFHGTTEINWPEIIPIDGRMHVVGKSVKSKLFSVPDCQAIVKKAVVQAMQKRYRKQWFEETGSNYTIEVSLLNDIATISIDTSGQGLHKRGYRTDTGEAPLRENLSAAMILLSRWDNSRRFADPLCGSGTIAIEAALIGKNIAPGLNRKFISEQWHIIPKEIWDIERETAKAKINNIDFQILASDIDANVLIKAKENAKHAGVAKYIEFKTMDIENFISNEEYGCIVCNPPYGERIGDIKNSEKLYKKMGQIFEKLNKWSFFILSPNENFQKLFGKSATKNRKLYNGNIKCHLYEYFGPLPKKKRTERAGETILDK
jgi:putative N6-adenine-specific DNA methylase